MESVGTIFKKTENKDHSAASEISLSVTTSNVTSYKMPQGTR